MKSIEGFAIEKRVIEDPEGRQEYFLTVYADLGGHILVTDLAWERLKEWQRLQVRDV